MLQEAIYIMDALYTKQAELGGSIQRIITNFKKDSTDRKTKPYYEQRLRDLNSSWNQFDANDSEIREKDTLDPGHEYFTKNYYDVIRDLFEQYSKIFQEKIDALSTTSAVSQQTHSKPIHNSVQLAEMTRLIRKQHATMLSLRRLIATLSMEDETQPPQYYKVNLTKLTKLWEEIESINYQVWELHDDPQGNGYNVEEYLLLEETVQAITIKLSCVPSMQQVNNNGPREESIRIPEVQIPKFDGDYLFWKQFYDLFNEMIHKRTIPNVQKIWYLKSSLSGEAAKLIQHFSLSSENYEAAWKMLQDRYNNLRLLTSTLIQKILSQPNHSADAPSASTIKALHDVSHESLLALKNLGIDTSSWDPLLLHILLKKLDKQTHMLYEQSLDKPRELQTLSHFLEFLEHRFQSLETLGSKDKKAPSKIVSSVVTREKTNICAVCQNGQHPLYFCNQFLNLSTKDRIHQVKSKNLCMNCLKAGHTSQECKSRTCTKCNKKHNTLLHLESSKLKRQDNTSTQPENSSVSLSTLNNNKRQSYVLLGTAKILLMASNGMTIECKAILDSGSQVNIVTSRVIKKLGLSPKSTSIYLEGIGKGKQNSHHRIHVTMKSKINNFTSPLEAVVLKQIVSPQPSTALDTSKWAIPENISLADPTFSQPAEIDVLIGAEFYHQVLSEGKIKIDDNMPILQNTVFGWVFSGKIIQPCVNTVVCGVLSGEDETNTLIERFWKLEELNETEPALSEVERQCENHFTQNTKRSNDGRFIVRLPLARKPTELGMSKNTAYNRFMALERRLTKNPDLRTKYINFMREYEYLGHMTKINEEDVLFPNYFIPHHCVLKPDSSTTKLRVVFDASCKTSSGLSLNDIQLNGPTVQSELFSILLRFRIPKFVFTTDIQKMYRQINMHSEDRRYQLILWREHSSEPLNCYQLNTVTYGTRAAPYLATKCLQTLALSNQEKRPLGANSLKNDFYVDDGLTGSNSLTEAIEKQRQLTEILYEAGFTLRKWCANHPRLLQGIPEEDQEVNLDLDDDGTQAIKTLGLTWLPKPDQFCVKANLNKNTILTKRVVASDLAKIFDPLGILAPVVVKAKIFLQQMWLQKTTWDEPLSAESQATWSNFRREMEELNNFKINRHIFSSYIPKEIQVHTFVDASEKAYGAAVYIRFVLTSGEILVRLLCAKSRVAPIKKTTIPRLELCAAVLGAQLTSRVKEDLQYNRYKTYYWSDSQIVLAWLYSDTAQYQVFVAHRITKIRELSLPDQWRHVSTRHNPADLVSRGILSKDFAKCCLWHFGPIFLHATEDNWPAKFSTSIMIETEEERKKKPLPSVLTTLDNKDLFYTINHGNSFKKLQRVVGYVHRFINHSKCSNLSRQHEIVLTPQELDQALMSIVRSMQRYDFNDEIKQLTKGAEIRKTSTLIGLTPFIDDTGILRVGGRLKNSTLSYDAKHQMLLPYNDVITKLIMQMIHKDNMHCGPTTLLAITRQRFWPIKGKSMARSIVQNCIVCVRARPKLLSQIMGNLPATRVTPARPFINTGVDFCGPFWIHYKLRGKRPNKAYIALFCCFATKAIHMELVSDLTTETFIGALKRFIGRRGHCKNLYCDNATNFVGAKNKLAELETTIFNSKAQENILTTCSQRGITFKFIPPRAPHFGGLWEAAVKSAKHLLLKNVSTESLTYEELETIIIEIEAILNSRPISPMSNDPTDLTALTPGHFLIGEPMNAQIDTKALPLKTSRLGRWKLVSQLKHDFWNRWSREYLNELQYKNKWNHKSANIKDGTMVLIKEDNLPVQQWPLGRIIDTYTGDDGFIRVADVKTSSGILKRAIHRLAPLPINTESPGNTSSYDSEEAIENISVSTTANQADEDTNRPTSKKRRTSVASYITTAMIVILLLPLVYAGKIKVTRFRPHLGIHFEDISTLNIASSQWNFLVYYDLEPLRAELSALSNGTRMAQQLCEEMQQKMGCDETIHNFQVTMQSLRFDDTLLSPKRAKRGAMNIVGNIAGSLFGVLDNEYAKKMSQTIDEIRNNEDHLMNLLRNQTSVIDSTINLLRTDATTTSLRFKQIGSQLNKLAEQLNHVSTDEFQIKLHQMFLSISAQLTLLMVNMQRVQGALLDVLADTHHGRINSLLLSTNQLKEELKTIRAHLPPLLKLPVDSDDFLQLYKLMTLKGGLGPHNAVFQITIPLINPEQFEIFKMIPVPTYINNTMIIIKPCASALAVGPHRDQYIPLNTADLQQCTVISSDRRLCFNLQAKYQKTSESCACELGLLVNEPQPTCILERARTNSTWIQLEKKNQWIFALRTPTRITTVCDQDSSQLTLEGTGLLTLEPECTIKGESISITGYQTFSTTLKTAFASFGNASQLARPTQIKQILSNFSTADYAEQIQNLTTLQTMLNKIDIRSLPHHFQMQYHVNTSLSIIALICSGLFLIIGIWRWRSKARTTSDIKPDPAPRRRTAADFSVHI